MFKESALYSQHITSYLSSLYNFTHEKASYAKNEIQQWREEAV